MSHRKLWCCLCLLSFIQLSVARPLLLARQEQKYASDSQEDVVAGVRGLSDATVSKDVVGTAVVPFIKLANACGAQGIQTSPQTNLVVALTVHRENLAHSNDMMALFSHKNENNAGNQKALANIASKQSASSVSSFAELNISFHTENIHPTCAS